MSDISIRKQQSKTCRNASIDLLRILCMVGVTLIHAIGYGLDFHALGDGTYEISQYTYLYVCIH